MKHYLQVQTEQTLITQIVTLENEIEQVESVRARRPGRYDARLNSTLRRLRRERASCLSVLLE